MAQNKKTNNRDRNARLTTGINLINQTLQIATGLISIPLTINYLSTDLFSIWMALVSVVTLLAFSDFGIGIGLQNRLTQAISLNDKNLARKVTANAISFSLIISLIIFISAYIIIPKIDWKDYLKLNVDTSGSLVEQAALLTIIATIIGIYANILQRIIISFQEGFLVAFFQCIARIIVLAAMYTIVLQDGGFLLLIFAIQGFGHLIQIALLLTYIIYKKNWLFKLPKITDIHLDIACLKDIFKIGGLGLSASIAYFLVTNSIPIALTNRFGSASIIDYMIVIKVTSIPVMLMTHLYSPLWPAVTDAATKGDIVWIKKSIRKNGMTLMTVIFISCGLLYFFTSHIIEFWIGAKSVAPKNDLIFSCLFMMALQIWNAYISTYLNGLGRYKSQASAGLIFAIISFAIANSPQMDLSTIQVIWIIIFGFMARCVYLQIELKFIYSNLSSK